MADETRNLDRSIGSNHWSIYIPGRPTAKKWSQKWRTWVFERQFQAPTRSPWISRWLRRGLKLPCFFSPCALANSAGGERLLTRTTYWVPISWRNCRLGQSECTFQILRSDAMAAYRAILNSKWSLNRFVDRSDLLNSNKESKCVSFRHSNLLNLTLTFISVLHDN